MKKDRQIHHSDSEQLSFDFTEMNPCKKEEQTHLNKNSQIIESDGISEMKVELKEFLIGTEIGNKSTWSGSYLNKSSQVSLKSNSLEHNGDKFTKEELISIMESLFDTVHYRKVVNLGDKGLKEWLINNVISQLKSKHIRQFLVKRSTQLNSTSLFQLIERFTDFQFSVCKATRKQPTDLAREDFLSQTLYDDVMTSQFYYHNFSLFFKQMNPFTETSLTYTPKGQKEVVLPQSVQLFLTYKRRQGTKKERLDKFRFEIHRFLRWSCNVLTEFKPYPIDRIPFSLFTQEHLRSYKNYLIQCIQSGRLSEIGSMNHLKNIKTFFATLYHIGYLKNDITRGIQNIQGDDYQSRYIPSDLEIERFFETIDRYSDSPQIDKLVFGFMFFLGLRSCEVAKLQWENINLSLNDVKFIAKGGKVHSLPLPSSLIDLLNEVKKQDNGLVFGMKPKSLNVVFALKYRIFTKVAGWKEASGPHQLRHIFITRLTEKGVTPKILKRLARHDSLATTSKYIHKTDDEIREKAMNLSLPWEED